MAKPEKKAPNANKAKGRETAQGQNTIRTFVHKETGDEVTGTMNEFHATLKDQGYRQKDEPAAAEETVVDGDITEQEPTQ